MSRLTRLTTTRLRNRLRRPWAIKPSILRGGLEMAPALPPRRTTVETFGQPLGVAEMAPALPPRRATVQRFGQPVGVAEMSPAGPPRPITARTLRRPKGLAGRPARPRPSALRATC